MFTRSTGYQGFWALVIAAGLILTMPAGGWAADDTTPPGQPMNVSVEEGDAWQRDAEFSVGWDNPPAQASPIAAANYTLCPAIPAGPCTTHQAIADNIDSASIVVPHIGWFWLQVWLEDSAGNSDPEAKSEPVMLRFDDQAPSPGRLRSVSEWLNASAPTAQVFALETDPNSLWPISGILGYSVTSDGSFPDATPDVAAAQDHETWTAEYEIELLPEGITELRFRGVSNAGVPSPEDARALVRVDRTSPTIAVDGLAGHGSWIRNDVNLTFTGADQPGLSGMDPAPVDKPATEGAYMLLAVDGDLPAHFRGAQVQVSLAADGVHALSARAFDRAGNSSDEESLTLKIDQTPPTGSFDRTNPLDPRQLSVSVRDALSGLATGRIEYRRGSAGGFTHLPTTLVGGKLAARLDELSLVPGRYEFRATVDDVAGNHAVIGHRADGKPVALHLPVRAATSMKVTASSRARRCATSKHRGRSKGKPKRRCRTVVGGANVAYGTPLVSTGRLTGTAGTPLAGAEVVVEGRLRSGGAFTRLGTTRTDGSGAFRFDVRAGSSRTVRYRYEGSNIHRAASAEVVTTVTAAARLTVDRRRARNGQVVRFAGRLLGKPIPAAGKLVALQARVGRGWRTFATPRARADGRFGHRYRFTATTGLRRYAFRALVTREAAYPFERGVSRTVRVTVRGR